MCDRIHLVNIINYSATGTGTTCRRHSASVSDTFLSFFPFFDFTSVWPTNSNECTHITQTDRQTVAWQQFYGNSTTHDYPLTQLPWWFTLSIYFDRINSSNSNSTASIITTASTITRQLLLLSALLDLFGVCQTSLMSDAKRRKKAWKSVKEYPALVL